MQLEAQPTPGTWDQYYIGRETLLCADGSDCHGQLGDTRKWMDRMAGNMTQYGMENFNGYDGSNPNFMIAKTTKTKVPPVNVNTYAPGSPKPMKDVEQEYEKPTANLTKLRQNFPGLGISPRIVEKEGILNEQNGPLTTNVDEDVKEATIKHLNRHATMLQARVHQLENMKDKLEAALKDKEQELARANEHIITLSQVNSRQMVQQRNQNIDVTANENTGDRDALWQEIHSLRMENSTLRKREESLVNKLCSLRESMVSLDHSQNLMSTQSCYKELESLHQVVDSLKSTVIQQRNYLLKLKAPQTAASSLTDPRVLTKAGSTAATGTANYPDLPRLRQGEEGTASSYPGMSGFVRNSPNPSSQSKTSDLKVSGTMTDVSNKNTQESVMHLAGLDVYSGLSTAIGDVYSENMMEDVDKLGSNLMYMNSIADVSARPHSNSPKPSDHGVVAKSASPKRDSASISSIRKTQEESAKDRPVRKTSRSEIIRQGPAPSLPVRSKTEHLGYNPQRKSQVVPEANSQWRTPVQPTVPTPRRQSDVAQSPWQEPSMGSSSTRPASVNLSQIPMRNSAQEIPVQNSAQSSHYNMRQQQWPLYANTSGVGGCAMEMRRSQAPVVGAGITPDCGNSNFDSVDCARPQSPRERLNSERLCPVCNREFGCLSIEEFQSHVLECFDNESGPETIVPDSSAPQPQRICPMCNTSFGDQMTQSDFEKHVHGHFGEDMPGDNFELLQP